MFIERKICGRLVSEEYRQFMAFNGWTNNLIPAVYEQFTPTHQFTKLIQDHENVDPDVAFSCVPYEKGSALLVYLEQKLGGPEVFEPYLRDYLNHLFKYFHDKKDILDTVNFDAWFFAVGMPPEKPSYDETMVHDCQQLFNQWIEADEEKIKEISAKQYKEMQPLQQIEFLSQLWQHDPPLEHYKLEALDALYELNKSQNCEIVLNWIRVCIKAKWEKSSRKLCGSLKYKDDSNIVDRFIEL
ncbi:unnamed protein product, partial [Mesorhabditis belari]|uniref:Peptidase M1 leukotriene A4 hydrolase/aminopeptidase C-terminal domain-containing protein n=1 Tax=Mesorhabditis belari TaxID=2138241 RepID=A0AAF3JBP1_9BILA